MADWLSFRYSILTAPTLVAAQAHVSTLRADLQRQASAKTAYSAASSSAIHHLDYLSNQWLKPGMWDSLSDAGRVAAAAKLGIPVADVANTSNHLESLNGLLKNKHLARYKRGGCRIRLDFLIWLVSPPLSAASFPFLSLTDPLKAGPQDPSQYPWRAS